jgi:CRP-like cAMP-binding protein
MTESWLTHLAKVPMFSECSKKELTEIAGATTPVSLSKGRVLVREGEPGNEAYVITSGTALVERKGARVAMLGPGDVIGEMALLVPGPRTATVTADTDLEVLVMNRREFGQLLEDIPDFTIQLLRNLASRMTVLDQHAFG